MLWTLVAVITGAVVTISATLPFAIRLASRRAWRRAAPRDHRIAVAQDTRIEPAFTPIDMGEDLVAWPSLRRGRRKETKLPPWPSETWDDPHFGRGRSVTVQLPATPAPAQPAKPAKPAPARRAPDVAVQERPRAPSPQRPTAPTAAELEALVASAGLAAAVKEIMARTGWDFKQSAKYLAKTRSS
ncbi:MAG: hypothetical protein ACI8PZ_005305 [Myxococcota bacterium]|jgi:hypothetical protein